MEHRELYSISCNNLKRKIIWKYIYNKYTHTHIYIYIYIYESLCYTPKTSTISFISYTSIQSKKLKKKKRKKVFLIKENEFFKALSICFSWMTLLLHFPSLDQIYSSADALLRPPSPPVHWPVWNLAMCQPCSSSPKDFSRNVPSRLSAIGKLSGKHVSNTASENAVPLNYC